MRTRSSRSYALAGPRDVYEVAGYGLLDTIEESFYLDDGSSELGEDGEGEDVGEEGEVIAVQHHKKSLVVKLRIPSRSNPVLPKERPCLMVVLRIPRSAGRVEESLVETKDSQLVRKHTPHCTSESVLDVLRTKELHEEPKKEKLERQGEASITFDMKISQETTCQSKVRLPGHVIDEKTEYVVDELKLETSEPIENEEEQVDLPEAMEIEFYGHDEVHEHSQEHQSGDKLSSSSEATETNNEQDLQSDSIVVSKSETACHQEEDISLQQQPAVKDTVKDTVKATRNTEDIEVHAESLPDTEFQGQIESQPAVATLEASERGSSPESSSTSSSHSADGSWPGMNASKESTASLVPTPLTMLSPDMASTEMATPPREPSPQRQSRKRRRSEDATSDKEEHSRKKHKMEMDSDGESITMSKLGEATRGTGVIEAGLAAQRRRSLPKPSQTCSPRQHTSHKPQKPSQQQQIAKRPPVKKPKRKPPEKSGRQMLLEHRISSSSQRLRGGGKSRATRPPKRIRNGS